MINKTDWNGNDIVMPADMNRIEKNQIELEGKSTTAMDVVNEFYNKFSNDIETIKQSINKYNYKYIILTDDDSKSSTYTTWYPLLKSYNIHGSISAIMYSSDYAGNCTKGQLLEMQENGFDILNHSSSTDSITTSNMKTIIPYALTIAKNNGYIAAQEIFVYPNGNDDSDVETYVYENFIAALGVTGTGNTNPLNFMNLCRINVDDSHEQATITSYVYNQVTDSDMVILCTHSYNGVSNLTAILEHYKNDNTVKFISMTEYNYLFNIYQLSTERGLYKYGIDNLNKSLTKFQTNFQDGCSTIASAITANGVTTASNATPTVMSTNIGNIRSGGTANADKILSGYTAYSGKNLLNGTNLGYTVGYNTGYTTGYNTGYAAKQVIYLGRVAGAIDNDGKVSENRGVVGVTHISGWQNFSVNNFLLVIAVSRVYRQWEEEKSNSYWGFSPVKSYNNSNGQLTITSLASANIGVENRSMGVLELDVYCTF